MLTVVYIQFPAALSVAELPSACSYIKHGLLTTVYLPAIAYVMPVLLTSAYIRKSVCCHFRGGSVRRISQHRARHL